MKRRGKMSVCIIVLTMQFYFQIELRQKFLKYMGKKSVIKKCVSKKAIIPLIVKKIITKFLFGFWKFKVLLLTIVLISNIRVNMELARGHSLRKCICSSFISVL